MKINNKHQSILKVLSEKLKYLNYSQRIIEMYTHYVEVFMEKTGKYHHHLLRHSCFTSLLGSGTDIRVIQRIAGHKATRTTEIYTHVSTQLLSKVPLPI